MDDLLPGYLWYWRGINNAICFRCDLLGAACRIVCTWLMHWRWSWRWVLCPGGAVCGCGISLCGMFITIRSGGLILPSRSCSCTLGDCGVMEVWKMVASWWRAARHSTPNLANGAAGAGFCSESTRPMADLMTIVSTEESRGMGHWERKHLTVLLVILATLFVCRC
jgi:hypothetical protein